MPRKPKAPLSQPIFGEPVFNEEVPTPDPSQFQVTPDDQKFWNRLDYKTITPIEYGRDDFGDDAGWVRNMGSVAALIEVLNGEPEANAADRRGLG